MLLGVQMKREIKGNWRITRMEFRNCCPRRKICCLQEEACKWLIRRMRQKETRNKYGRQKLARKWDRSEIRREKRNQGKKWYLMSSETAMSMYMCISFPGFSQRKVTLQAANLLIQLAAAYRGILQLPALPAHKKTQIPFPSDWSLSSILPPKKL